MVLAILQARMSSTRLPGKVLAPILGEPMLGRQIERLRRAGSLSRIVVATSDRAEDDAIAAYCRTLEVPCFSGRSGQCAGAVPGRHQGLWSR